MNRVLLASALLLLAFAGCRKPKPSPFFSEAQGKYSSLVAELGDPAFSDERMTAVEELLKKVPNDSLDAIAAAELTQKIKNERKRVAEEAAAHERALANVNALPPDLPDSRPAQNTEKPDQVVDAAVPDLAVGISIDEMRKQSGDCFNPAGSIKLRRSAVDENGEMWERREAAGCPKRWPQYTGKILVFVAGKLTGSYEKSSLKDEPPQAAKPPPPEAPKPPAEPLPPQGSPAGTPQGGENTGPGPSEPQ